MEAFKISVEVNVNLNLTESTQQFIQNLLLGKAEAPVQEAPKSEAPVQEAPKAEAPKKNAKAKAPKAEAPVQEAPKAEAPVQEAPKAEAPVQEAPKAEAPAPAITVDDVRRELAKKVGSHRESIKQKLNSLDAPSVTKLNPEKYQEMFDFLKALPGNED